MPIVLTAGSLHYDIMVEADHLPARDETAYGTRWYPKFGGKGGNQAVAAAKAGAQSRMIGAVGADDFGRFLRAQLRLGQVDDRFIATVVGVGSGMSVALQDPAGDYAATIVSGANLHIAPQAVDDAAVWDGVSLLILQNEVPEAINLAAATQARARGIPTLLNAAPFRALSPAFERLVDILVVNAVEAQMIGTDPVTNLETAAVAAQRLADRFGQVIVTAGGAGLALCAAQNQPIRIAAERITVVSSHGAGDSFIGTLAAQLAAGAEMETACRAASQAAARHVAGQHG
ncbi:MAG: PfkB family carbohydrate kinase [Cypionkella sp.]